MPGQQSRQRDSASLVVLCCSEDALSHVLQQALEDEGLILEFARTADEALSRIERARPEIVVLDGTFGDAVALSRRLTLSSDPISTILLIDTGESDQQDGIAAGEASDILSKPVGPSALVAAIQASLAGREKPLLHPFIDLSLDANRHMVWCRGKEIVLTGIEFELLRLLLQKPGTVLSRDQLIRGAWPGQVFVDQRTVTIHMGRLRRRLSSCCGADLIRTVRGYGYALIDRPDEAGGGVDGES